MQLAFGQGLFFVLFTKLLQNHYNFTAVHFQHLASMRIDNEAEQHKKAIQK